MSGGVTKFEIEKFDGSNFNLWKMKVEDLLVQNDQALALKIASDPTNITDEEWAKLDNKAISTVHLYLVDFFLFNVAKEKTAEALLEKLEKLYKTKIATNKVFLKKKSSIE